MKKKYICIKQHDVTDCGAACIATIARQYGLKVPISKIREIAGTDRQGTNAYGIVKAAEELGFSAKAVRGENEAIFSDFPLPAIAHVIVNRSLMHYVVIHKITRKKITAADPARGMVTYTPEEFFGMWTGTLIILVPSPKFERRNDTDGTLFRFFKLLLPQKVLIFNIFLSSLIISVFGILASFYFQIIVDEIVPNSLFKTLIIISIGILLLNIFKILLEAFRNHLMAYLSQKLDIPLILGYYHHVLGLPMSFFGARRVGEIISRFMDASKIREAISGATLTIMIDTLMAAAGAVILCVQNVGLFFIAVLIAVIYGIIVFCFNKPIRNINEKQMEENSKVTSYLVETLNGIETVKSFNAEDKAQEKTENLFVKFLKSEFKGQLIFNAEQSLTNAVATIGGTVILWVGTASVLKGNLTLGSLITFNALLLYFLDPVKNLINLQPTMQTAVVAADRLSEVLDLELEKNKDERVKLTPSSLRTQINIKDLSFGYGTREDILHDINMTINPGEKIALVGESGSGKTSLVKLLMRFYDWKKGDITFDGYNIKDMNIERLRNKVAYISQDIFLFSGTIKENLMMGNIDCSFEEIVKACKLSKADDFINELPLRYDTVLEENGANLSGGQKQRLAIARALIKNPHVLIMDEATSNLDSITEKSIEQTIHGLTEGTTTIIIAHRLSTIMSCDKIYVMDKGKIIEQGTHHELMESKGKYFRLWKDQLPVSAEVV